MLQGILGLGGLGGGGGGGGGGPKKSGGKLYQFDHDYCDLETGMAGAFDLLKKKGDPGPGAQAKEDPIKKAEREFFEIIKKVDWLEWSLMTLFTGAGAEAGC